MEKINFIKGERLILPEKVVTAELIFHLLLHNILDYVLIKWFCFFGDKRQFGLRILLSEDERESEREMKC